MLAWLSRMRCGISCQARNLGIAYQIRYTMCLVHCAQTFSIGIPDDLHTSHQRAQTTCDFDELTTQQHVHTSDCISMPNNISEQGAQFAGTSWPQAFSLRFVEAFLSRHQRPISSAQSLIYMPSLTYLGSVVRQVVLHATLETLLHICGVRNRYLL